MAINTYLSTTESKKQTKQQDGQRQNHGCGGHFDGSRWEGYFGEWVKR